MFAGKIADASDPDALEAGPRIIPLDDKGKPIAPATPAVSAPSYSVASAESADELRAGPQRRLVERATGAERLA